MSRLGGFSEIPATLGHGDIVFKRNPSSRPTGNRIIVIFENYRHRIARLFKLSTTPRVGLLSQHLAVTTAKRDAASRHDRVTLRLIYQK